MGPPSSESRKPERLDLALMNAAREELAIHPSDTEAKKQWKFGVEMYCRQDGNALYKGLDGKTESCGGEAKQFYDLMEQFRTMYKETKQMLDEESPKRDSMLRASFPSISEHWREMRKTYCQVAPSGRYLDLDDKEQSCKDLK